MSDSRDAAPWFRRRLVGVEIGPTGANDQDRIYMSRATGREWVENLLRAKAEYGVLFMKDQDFAYYPSRVARHCPNLGGRDLLRECLEHAKPHGISIIAYCQVQYDTSSWRARPEWRMRDSAGADIPGRLCYRSGYLEFIEACAAEMMAYEIAGFHFDMLDFGFSPPYGCWCETCRRDFERAYGKPMPPGVTWDDAWDKMLDFRCASNAEFCRALEAFVKSQRPEVTVGFNYHGCPPFNWVEGERPVQHAAAGDLVTAEGLPFVFGHANASLLALFMAGARPGGPCQGVTSRSVFDYHDFTVRPAAELAWETFTYLAHGAQCTIVDKGNYEGTLDSVAYGRIGQVFGEARDKREYFGHAPVEEVGLYYSSRSRDWYAREEPPRYFAAFSGAHKALLQAHIPMGMIMDENVSLPRLRGFPVVYLPHPAILSAEEIALFARYAADGGRLLITGLAGMYDRDGRLQDHSDLSDLIGARLVGCITDYPDNYLRLPADLAAGPGGFLLDGIPPDWPMLTWGPAAALEAEGAEAFGEVLAAHRTKENQWHWRMSAGEVIGPAVFVNQYGRGTVVYVACLPDAAFAGDYRVPEHRNLLRSLVRYLNPAPEVVIEAPPNVETVVTRDNARGRLLVHLLAFWAPATATAAAFPEGRHVLPPVMEQALPYRAEVVVRKPFSGARTVGPDARAAIAGSRITLDTPNVHEVLVIEA
jgi:hypothetical protein